MNTAYVGLDLGTTGIKAVAFDESAVELAHAARQTPTHRGVGGIAEYDAIELWETACLVLRELTETLATTGHQTVSIAVASMGEAGVLLDSDGSPLAPVIAWFDERTAPQADWWSEAVGVERTQRIAGVSPRPVFGAAKMLWTKEHLPDAWAAGECWLNMADWAAYRLSGHMATDYSLASRTMLFDVAKRSWSSELIGAAGLEEALLAPVVQSGSVVGRVTAQAAAETGLPIDAVVGAGGQDHVCAALALGVTEPGMLLDSIGTAEAFFLVTERFEPDGRYASAGIGQGVHVEPGRTYAMTGLQQGGGRIDARRIELGLEWQAFLDTNEATTVIDSVAADGQERIEAMLTVAGDHRTRHVVTGGGSRNTRLIAQKESIGGRPIEVAEQTQATALGAAILGRRALEFSSQK